MKILAAVCLLNEHICIFALCMCVHWLFVLANQRINFTLTAIKVKLCLCSPVGRPIFWSFKPLTVIYEMFAFRIFLLLRKPTVNECSCCRYCYGYTWHGMAWHGIIDTIIEIKCDYIMIILKTCRKLLLNTLHLGTNFIVF